MNHRPLAFAALLGTVGLAGCASSLVDHGAAGQPARVAPVTTEHSEALACLGQMIDRKRTPRLTVFVADIEDRTVPERFEGRRLSGGASWWLHTAIGKLDTDRVVSTLENPGTAADTSNHLVLSGAWTQDDMKIGKIGGELAALVSKLGIGFGATRSFDVIAGDFVSARDGRVIHASGISLMVGSGQTGLNLRIEDGSDSFEIDLSDSHNEGPQFAQRRITEAAALVHVAHAFRIDYRPCMSAGWS